MTHYLRFPNETTALAALVAAGLLTENLTEQGKTFTISAEHPLYLIGIMYNDDAVRDPDGKLITSPTPKDGWHFNYQGEIPEEWNAFTVHPASPFHTFG